MSPVQVLANTRCRHVGDLADNLCNHVTTRSPAIMWRQPITIAGAAEDQRRKYPRQFQMTGTKGLACSTHDGAGTPFASLRSSANRMKARRPFPPLVLIVTPKERCLS